MNQTTWKHKLLIVGLMTVLALIMTWPLAQRPATTVNDYGDPLLNAWILWWDVKALTTPGLSLFNAPIFYPSPLTLAYSEHLLVSALTVSPLLFWGADALLAYNVMFLLSFIIAGLGGYLLGYELTGSRSAALVAGIGFGFAPFRFGHLGHLQILTAHFMPLVMLYLHRWAKRPTWPLALGWGLFWLLQVLSCGYHGLFISLAVGLFLVFYGWRRSWWRVPRRWLQVGAVAVLLAVLVAPFYLPYRQVQKDLGFKRSLGQAAAFSARPRYYLAAPPANNIYGKLTTPFRGPEGELFLGLTLTALVALALLGRVRRRRPQALPQADDGQDQQNDPQALWFYLLLALFAVWASLGPQYGLYSVLYRLIPGFDAIRVPSRMVVLVTLAWAALAALGVKRLQELFSPQSLVKKILGPGLALLILAESCSVPIPWAHIWEKTPEVYEWLARKPSGTIVMEVPTLGHRGDHARDARYLYWSTKHGQTLVNGYSGFFPPGYLDLAKRAARLPAPEVVEELGSKKVKYLVLHLKEYPRPQAKRLLEQYQKSSKLKLVFNTTWDYVFEILAGCDCKNK